jgi:hypothetical protein
VARQEVRGFMALRAEDARRDLPLLTACAGDLHKQCAATQLGGGRVLKCLKVRLLPLH